ncbi:myoferlin-like, partial [Cyanistes caeruleus]|uniref:myoferlin-like n=1 Tax=Cyanistes caeruleus TaxID=156563 RepID=UPI000CDA3FB3
VSPSLPQVLRSPHACIKPIIGVFQLDIGTVYSAPGRSLSWKWLSLQHPQHRDGRSQGFLQLSLRVRRAGESAPVSPPPSPAPQKPQLGSVTPNTPAGVSHPKKPQLGSVTPLPGI